MVQDWIANCGVGGQ